MSESRNLSEGVSRLSVGERIGQPSPYRTPVPPCYRADRRRATSGNNKKKKDGFTLFLRQKRRDLLPKLQAEGIPEEEREKSILREALRLWEDVPEDEKDSYEKKAKAENALLRRNPDGKLVAELEREEQKVAAKMAEMKNRVRADLTRVAKSPGGLRSLKFCVISVNVFLPLQADASFQRPFIPAEYFMTSCCVSSGPQKNMSSYRIMVPKETDIPCGLTGDVYHHLRETHRIPLDFPGNRDFSRMADEVEFICRNSDFPVIFVPSNKVQEAELFIEWLWEKGSRDRTDIRPKVCSLDVLVDCMLVQIWGEKPGYRVQDVFDSNVFEHTPGLACSWHEGTGSEGRAFCARYECINQAKLITRFWTGCCEELSRA